MREPVQFGVRPLRSMKSSFSLAEEIKRIRTEHWKQNIPARYHRLPKLGARPKCNVARKDSEGLKQVGGYRIGLQDTIEGLLALAHPPRLPGFPRWPYEGARSIRGRVIVGDIMIFWKGYSATERKDRKYRINWQGIR
jgi:hypothetical protein